MKTEEKKIRGLILEKQYGSGGWGHWNMAFNYKLCITRFCDVII